MKTLLSLRALRDLLQHIGGNAPTKLADNPLIMVEQLRGRVLRYREQLAAIEDHCDALHFALSQQPEADRWRTELVAYERAEHAREQDARAQGHHGGAS
jgi:hypothetical protein